jgi:hypothetical protein
MKTRFSDEQIISILHEAEAGFGPGTLPQACYVRGYLLHLAQEVWRHGSP